VPVILGVTSTQYPRWCDLILLMLQCYTLDDHVSCDTPTLNDPNWRRMDSVVLLWLLDTITIDLQETTHAHDRTRDCTTPPLWVALEEHALHLDA
jgi:hypothetical protein